MTQTAEKTQPDTIQKLQTKRLIFVTGDKGGTGKSTFARGLLDVLQHKGIEFTAYDSDKRNAQLYRYYKEQGDGVKRINILSRGGADALIDDMEQVNSPVMLVDLPAGAGEAFERFEAEMGLISTANELGYQVSVVSVLSRVKDSVNALRIALEFAGDAVKTIAVKNLYFGEPDKFRLFDGSKVRERLLEQAGMVITLPDLFDDTYELIDQQSLPFHQAAGDKSPLTRAHRSRVYQWLKLFEAEVSKAGIYLGMPS